MSDHTANADKRIRLGMVGGGQGAFIGAVHRIAARLDDRYTLVAGALSSGCSILKASEETPAGAVQLVRAFHNAGLPPGVLNLVFGNPAEISNYLIPQSSIRLITFTGSIPVGKALAEMAGRHMKPAIMELGGHAPVIVCEERRSGHDRRDIRHGQVAQRRPSLRCADGSLSRNRSISVLPMRSPQRLRN